jgi:shikimate kinase
MHVPHSGNSSRALRVEIIGLAGAGKTTLTRTLMSMRAGLQVGLPLPKTVVYRHVVNRSLGLFPSFLRQLPGSRWFNTKETKAIIYLEAWRRALTRGTADGKDAILFDHGPLFWLTRIRAIGPAFTRSPEPERWWRGEVLRWAGLLDALVFLDAPDDILMHRIRTRNQDHIVKHDSDETIRRFLSRFRSAFHEATAIASEDSRIVRYEFDTTLKRPQQIAEAVLEIIEQRREALRTR